MRRENQIDERFDESFESLRAESEKNLKKKISKGSMELKINFFISIAIYDRSSNWLLNYSGRINTNCTLIRRSVRDNFPRIAPRICAIIRNPWWHSIDYERSHAFKRNGLCVRRVIDREEEKEKEREREEDSFRSHNWLYRLVVIRHAD